jgi:hypothetical protein
VFFILLSVITHSLISFLKILSQLQPALNHFHAQHFPWTIPAVLLTPHLIAWPPTLSEVVVAEGVGERVVTM